jgi:hypothetical protein
MCFAARVALPPDGLQHYLQIVINIRIPETQNLMALSLQAPLSCLVELFLAQMCFPIDLQDEGDFSTVEIHNK